MLYRITVGRGVAVSSAGRFSGRILSWAISNRSVQTDVI
jgi:hypothetical protein